MDVGPGIASVPMGEAQPGKCGADTVENIPGGAGRLSATGVVRKADYWG
jgi:hypothetical protein